MSARVMLGAFGAKLLSADPPGRRHRRLVRNKLHGGSATRHSLTDISGVRDSGRRIAQISVSSRAAIPPPTDPHPTSHCSVVPDKQ